MKALLLLWPHHWLFLGGRCCLSGRISRLEPRQVDDPQQGPPLYDAVGGMHHIYANKKAMAGYKTGKFADGSVLVFDLFEAVDKDNAVSKATGRPSWSWRKRQGPQGRPLVGLPGVRRQNPPEQRSTPGQADCHTCHVAQKDKDFVFSAWRD